MSKEEGFIFDSDVPNDSIDIHSNPKLTVRKLDPKRDAELRLEFEGQSVDNSIVNAIRRTVMMNIPIYAFHRSNITIDVKRSRHMYNNDLIYNQIETLPIYDIPNYFDLENPETFLPSEVLRNLFGTFLPEDSTEEQPEPDKRLFKIELSIDTKNITDRAKYVSTHDAVLKINGKTSNNYLNHEPVCILVLKPGEEISLRAEANLGINKMNAIYDATTNAILDEISYTKFHLWYETLGQLDKNIIFTKACIILTKKLENLSQFLEKNYEERRVEEKIEIDLHGEDHTLGNLLATVLQKSKYVSKAGYLMKHPFGDIMTIRYLLKSDSKLGPIRVLIDSCQYLVKVFQLINNQFLKNRE